MQTKLYRSSKNRQIAGVLGGLSERFKIPVQVLRFIFVIFGSMLGIGVIPYLLLLFLIKEEPAYLASYSPPLFQKFVLGAIDGSVAWAFMTIPLFIVLNVFAAAVVGREDIFGWGVPTTLFLVGTITGLLYGGVTRTGGGAVSGVIAGAIAAQLAVGLDYSMRTIDDGSLWKTLGYSAFYLFYVGISTLFLGMFSGALGGGLSALSNYNPFPHKKAKYIVFFIAAPYIMLLLFSLQFLIVLAVVYAVAITYSFIEHDKVFAPRLRPAIQLPNIVPSIMREMARAIPVAIGATIGQVIGEWLGYSLYQKVGSIVIGAMCATIVEELVTERKVTTKVIGTTAATIFVAIIQIAVLGA